MSLQARVYGNPRPQGSKRAMPWHAKDGRHGIALLESSGENLKSWRSAVRDALLLSMVVVPVGEPVTLSVIFWLQPPKAKRKWAQPAKKPDLSKLVRAIEDELTGLWIRDDAQIVEMHCSKNWADAEHPVGAAIEIGPVATE